MEPELDPWDVRLLFTNGSSVSTTIEGGDIDSLKDYLPSRPGWTVIGDVLIHTHNLVAIQPIYDDEEGE